MPLKDYEYYRTDLGVLYHADCLQIMPMLEPVDLVLTDPPYGIDYNSQRQGLNTGRKFDDITNDKYGMDLQLILNMDCCVISFGASNYPSQLPHKGIWLCWYKRGYGAENALGSPFELAWINRRAGQYKFYHVIHGGFVNSDGGTRLHPTQKPVQLFIAIMEDFSKKNQLILDPFLGSGTTAISCERLNRRWIGIEIEEKYCEIAAKRIENERKQRKLF